MPPEELKCPACSGWLTRVMASETGKIRAISPWSEMETVPSPMGYPMKRSMADTGRMR